MCTALWGEDEPEVNNLLRRPSSFPKPKGMHWRAYEKKCKQIVQSEDHYFRGLLVVLDRHYWGRR
ncbi:hypothetical protein ACP26F_15770 [Franconibacter pulveris 1160]|uniref:hypothetical protein n=1 Tax=Franconibacter pulveris TaxID=435910 RepID=UPI000B1CFDA2|nr:hypothetical protein [Franconibacter pulveris]